MGVIAGALLIVMPIYGYIPELGIIIATVLFLFYLHEMSPLSMGIAMLVLPFLFWLGILFRELSDVVGGIAIIVVESFYQHL